MRQLQEIPTNQPGTLRLSNVWDLVQRITPALVDGKGNWTPYTAAAQLYDTVEFRTTATPTFAFNVATMDDPTPNPITQKLKPTIILRGPLGTRVIAPHGVADQNAGALVGLGTVVGASVVIGTLGFLLGRAVGRRKRNRELSGYEERREKRVTRRRNRRAA